MTAPAMSRDEYLKAKYVWSGGDIAVSDRPPASASPGTDAPERDRKTRKS